MDIGDIEEIVEVEPIDVPAPEPERTAPPQPAEPEREPERVP